MAETTTDELDQLDQAFAGNLLLATFSPEIRAVLEPFGEVVELELVNLILRRG